MGIEPFLVTASLNLILAQRLARKLCPACKRPSKTIEEQALLDVGVPPDKIGSFTPYEKAGCRTCNDRGYKGRVALYEVMPFCDGLKELVLNGASTAELKQEAIRLGMQTLRMAALEQDDGRDDHARRGRWADTAAGRASRQGRPKGRWQTCTSS